MNLLAAHIDKSGDSDSGGAYHSPSENTDIDNDIDKHTQDEKSEPKSLTIQAVVDDHTRRKSLGRVRRLGAYVGLRGAPNEKGARRDTILW